MTRKVQRVGALSLAHVAGLVHADQVHRHPARAAALQRAQAVAHALETHLEAALQLFHVIARAACRLQEFAIGQQQGTGKVVRQPLPCQRARLCIGQCGLVGTGLIQQVAMRQKAQLRGHLEGLLCIAQLGLEHQTAPARIVLAQLQRVCFTSHHLDAMRLLQLFP